VAGKTESGFRSGVEPGAPFGCVVRVYYEDTDAGGVVYYANYLKYFERCRTEFLRSLGIDQTALARERALQFVVSDLQARYLRSARLDDRLLVDATPISMSRCSVRFLQHVWRGSEELTRATVTVVCIDILRQLPCRLPPSLVSRLPPRPGPALPVDAAVADPARDRANG
jgi:acyl-CoA thioester hydrolase